MPSTADPPIAATGRRYGQAFLLDALALAAHRSGQVLALDAGTIGTMIALPVAVTANVYAALPSRPGKVDPSRDDTAGSQVAIVAIDGPLSQRGEDHPCGQLDGYDWIAERFAAAHAEPRVGAVIMRINSPGGDVAGLDAGVARMVAAKKASGKRTIAFVDELAASAAYRIAASVADEIMVPKSGRVGSIGVVGTWVDASAKLAAEGMITHVVRDPPGKNAENPASPVAAVADERMTLLVQEFAADFIAAIAKARPIKASAIRALNGALRHGQAAVDEGLADRVGSLEDAIALAAGAAEQRKKAMSETKLAAALGLTADASDAEIAAAALRFQLADTVMALTGKSTPAEAAGTVAAWKDSAAAAATLRTTNDQQTAEIAKRDLSAYLLSQIGIKLTPALAWAKGPDGVPIAGEPAPRWSSLEYARSYVADAPPLSFAASKGSNDPAARMKPIGGGGLTERQLQICAEMGVKPESFAQLLTARESARSAH